MAGSDVQQFRQVLRDIATQFTAMERRTSESVTNTQDEPVFGRDLVQPKKNSKLRVELSLRAVPFLQGVLGASNTFGPLCIERVRSGHQGVVVTKSVVKLPVQQQLGGVVR